MVVRPLRCAYALTTVTQQTLGGSLSWSKSGRIPLIGTASASLQRVMTHDIHALRLLEYPVNTAVAETHQCFQLFHRCTLLYFP
jgi:hypothetical protein